MPIQHFLNPLIFLFFYIPPPNSLSLSLSLSLSPIRSIPIFKFLHSVMFVHFVYIHLPLSVLVFCIYCFVWLSLTMQCSYEYARLVFRVCACCDWACVCSFVLCGCLFPCPCVYTWYPLIFSISINAALISSVFYNHNVEWVRLCCVSSTCITECWKEIYERSTEIRIAGNCIVWTKTWLLTCCR